MSASGRSSFFLLALAPLAALAVSGCGDAMTGPPAVLLAEEAQAALRVAADLPTLASLVERTLAPAEVARADADTAALVQARALWLDAAGAGDPGDAEAMRRAAYALAAPALAAALDSAAIESVQRNLEGWVHMAAGVVTGADLPGISGTLAGARSLLDGARRAQAEGDRAAAVAALLRAADRLAATTPRAVARRLIQQAERHRADRVGKGAGTGADAADLSVRRADRLLRGAHEALGEGDYERAIRRAFYAAQLLRATPR